MWVLFINDNNSCSLKILNPCSSVENSTFRNLSEPCSTLCDINLILIMWLCPGAGSVGVVLRRGHRRVELMETIRWWELNTNQIHCPSPTCPPWPPIPHPLSACREAAARLSTPPPPLPSLSFIHDRAESDDKDDGRGEDGGRGVFLCPSANLVTPHCCYRNPVSPVCHLSAGENPTSLHLQHQRRELTLILCAANHSPPQPPLPLIGSARQQQRHGTRVAAAGQRTQSGSTWNVLDAFKPLSDDEGPGWSAHDQEPPEGLL